MRDFTSPNEKLEVAQQKNYFKPAECSECHNEINCYISRTICKTDILCVECAIKKGIA